MKSISLVAVSPSAHFFGSRRFALTLAVIVTLLAALVIPIHAQEQPAAPAPAKPDPAGNSLPAVDHLIYLATLPTPAALMKEAAAQGLTIARIDRTGDNLVVVYKYADGHTDTTGFTTLAAASTTEVPMVTGTAPAQIPASTAGTVTAVQPTPTYTVVSYQPAPVYYGPRYYYEDPFWEPLALGIGLGFVVGGHGGHGGYYHGHGGYSGRGGFHH